MAKHLYEVGHEGMGGRPKGSRTKNTQLRDLIRDFCIDKFEDYVSAFDQLTPKEKCDEYTKALQFVVPRVSAVTFDDESKASTALQHLKIIAEYKKGGGEDEED
jgi:hypothetical protein